jgi:hypothetical protein
MPAHVRTGACNNAGSSNAKHGWCDACTGRRYACCKWHMQGVAGVVRACWLWCTAMAEATSPNSTKHVTLRCPRT